MHGPGPGQGRERELWARAFLAFAWLIVALGFLNPTGAGFGSSRALAQDDEPAAEAAAPAPEAPAPAPAADDSAVVAEVGTSEAPVDDSLFMLVVRSSGLIGLFLLLISIYFVATVINLYINISIPVAVPPALVNRIETAVKERKFQEVYDMCKEDNSFVARLVRTGVANLPNGKAEAKEAVEFVSHEVVTEMEAKISYLAVIGTLGPMIGLVGTITGMIRSFRELASAVAAQPKPSKVAEGIMEALFLTLEGVALSVPAIFFYAYFRNRIAKITVEANKVADRVINGVLAAVKSAKTA